MTDAFARMSRSTVRLCGVVTMLMERHSSNARLKQRILRIVQALGILMASLAIVACESPVVSNGAREIAGAEAYVWERVAEHAPFPESYNYPVHIATDGAFVALHPEGTWRSREGANWTLSNLPPLVLNSAYMNYVFHDGATWALGRHTGNYERFEIDPLILRTRDYSRWETVGRAASFPPVVFSAAASFQGAVWMIGGYDGTRHRASVWRSTDGVSWTEVVTVAPWSPRAGAKAIEFKNRLFLIGGGVIDGAIANDVWSSPDGIDWRQETESIAPEEPVGFTPIVFDDQLWLVGANRSGNFRSEMLVSGDGRNWRAVSAPWSPRGGVAAWTDGHFLFITGGKYSVERDGETTFLYSNDVWRMRAR